MELLVGYILGLLTIPEILVLVCVWQAISSGAIPTFDIVYPVGCTYTQFPNCPSPNDLWGSLSKWTELDFGGAFFRASGGNAKTFNSGSQADSVKSHTHSGTTGNVSGSANEWSHTHSHMMLGGSGSDRAEQLYGNDNSNFINKGVWSTNWTNNRVWSNRHSEWVNLQHTHGFTTDSNDTSATENRPFNYTVKIWKRTA